MTDKADEYIAKAPTLTIFDGLVKANSVLTNNKNILASVSGGADSDCMIDIVENLIPRDGEHDVTYVWFDTGVEMDATKRHLSFLEEKYDIKIHRSLQSTLDAYRNTISNGKMNRLMSCAPNTRIVMLPFAGGVTLGKTNRINHSRPKLNLLGFLRSL